MTRSRDIASLQGLARLVLDHRLSQLRQAADRREQSLLQIAALELSHVPTDLGLATTEQVVFRYQTWADSRRTELNAVLAGQTAEWMAAQDEARQAFGKTEALRGIAARLPKGS